MPAELSTSILAAVLVLQAALARDPRETYPVQASTKRCDIDAAGTCRVTLDDSSPRRMLRILGVDGLASPWSLLIVTNAGAEIGRQASSDAPSWSEILSLNERVTLQLTAPGAKNVAATIRLETADAGPSRFKSDPQSSTESSPISSITLHSKRIQSLARSIGILTVRPINAFPSACTAFLVTDTVLMTNAHCLDGLKPGWHASVQFDYDEAHQANLESYRVTGEMITGTRDKARARELDLAMLRLAASPGGRLPLVLSTRPPAAEATQS